MSLPSLQRLRGAERPRVEVRPEAVESLGDEAAALAAAAGLPLEPWQLDGLHMMLSLRADRKWACFEYGELCPRQNGKSALLMARALAGLFLLDERLILWSAHEYKTAMRSFTEMRELLRTLGDEVSPFLIDVDGIQVRVENQVGREYFQRLDTGAMIKMIARSKASGRGFSTDCMIVDEAFAYTELQQDALMPTLTARPNPQICYASSPPLDGRTGGPLFALRRRAAAGEATALGWRDWGLPGDLDELTALEPTKRAAFLDDQERWAASNPAVGGPRVDLESIARLRMSMSESGFAREVLGMWPRQAVDGGAWQVISKATWEARGGLGAVGGGEPRRPSGAVAFALEASWPDAAYGALASAGWDGDELLVQLVDYRPGTAWLVARAVELLKHDPVAVVLDKGGPAGHLLAPLREALEDAGVEVLTPTTGEIGRAHGTVCAAVGGDEPSLRHYDQQELTDAVRSAGTRPLGDARTWARQGEGDISPLGAVTLAVHGLNARSYEPWAEWG